MTRSQLKVVAPMVLGLAVVLLGLLALLRMVSAERRDALSATKRQSALVLAQANSRLLGRLENHLQRARAQMVAAQADPLLACDGCLLAVSGEQVLPRLRPQGGAGNSAEFWYQALLAGRAEGDSMWSQRINLQAQCEGPDGVAKLAAFRANFALPAQQELASSLAMAEHCALGSGEAVALLRGVSGVPGQRGVEGLQQLFLRRARELSAKDAEYLLQRIIRASSRAQVSSEELKQRFSELAEKRLDVDLRHSRAVLVLEGRTYYASRAGEEEVGVAVTLGDDLAVVAQSMREAGLMFSDDVLSIQLGADHVEAQALPLELESPKTQGALRSIQSRYRVKLGLLGLSGAFCFIIAAMGLLLQRRRVRILELKSHFVAGVSHELKTPLASMRVLAETLERRTRGMSEVRDYPQRLVRDIDGMTFLVENILSFNRLTKGRMEPKREVMNVGELFFRAVDEVREHSGKTIEIISEAADANVTGDPELLALLFRNLVANAVAYNRHNVVKLSLDTRVGPAHSAHISLGDNGIGVSAADRSGIFDEFFRGEGAALARGSGLGLALCKRIVELHGGTIGIERTGPEGTTFGMEFP